ncbi:family 2A encapsulin nanocompartment cargo protein cysteine desulfurase [Flavobacterium adhaerens]|uniref:family 2A encapsulin nanocompartment cargo protein cysteine desulfurase n=1 Tax=Flavobacterium adhaerens TaxID=3149043 RepID=UPI0032B60CBE
MNTNTNHLGLPNIDELQQLANELFSALPNEIPKQISLSPDPNDHPRATKIAETLLNVGNLGVGETVFPVSNHDTALAQLGHSASLLSTPPVITNSMYQYPPSIGGIGVSPSVGTYIKDSRGVEAVPNVSSLISDIPFMEQNHNGMDVSKYSLGSQQVPASVEKEIVPENIQSSFDDSNLDTKNETYLPFEYEGNSFEAELRAALNLINSDFRSPSDTGIVGNEFQNSYYFLEHNPFAFDSKKSDISNVVPVLPKNNSWLGSNFDAYLIKKDFPILNETVNGKPLIWFDNAATTQKPQSVIDRVKYFYEHENSNIHRAAHELAARASDAYEAAREKVRAFLNASSVNEIVFVRGATEGVNLVAESWGNHKLNAGDEIIVSHLEHHANIVPWKRLADKKGLVLKVIPVDDDGQILLGEYAKLLTPKTKLVAFTQVSNALGTITPAKQMVEMAHAVGAKVLLDGAQSVSHMKVDVQYLDADWLVFSGHKLFGPTGIGTLYGKEDLLNEMEPYQGGGNMIQDVTFEEIKYHKAPHRFEAGTGNIADAIGLGAAIDYVSKIGIEVIGQYEHYLLEYATDLLKQIPDVRLIGTAEHKASVLSFTLEGFSNDQVGQALNREGIAVRTGHHCAQPILRRMGVETTVRPSLAFYNTSQDVDVFIETLWRLKTK